MTDRKLATIRTIDALEPIPDADKIEVAVVGGWRVVVQKGLYKAGDKAVYFEIDSWMPHALAPFLTDPSHFSKVFEGVEGQRLKSKKLRGVISQGLLIPLTEVVEYLRTIQPEEIHGEVGIIDFETDDVTVESKIGIMSGDVDGTPTMYFEGDDLTELLGILKWEKVIPATMGGVVRGSFPGFMPKFPGFMPKTDQERLQNLKSEFLGHHDEFYNRVGWFEENAQWEISEKLDGTSCTIYIKDGEFGVCSRNLELKETEGNVYWNMARKYDIEQKLRDNNLDNLAIQGEIIGPGIQNNRYGLKEPDFYVFDIFDIKTGRYLTDFAVSLCDTLGLKHVPFWINNLQNVAATYEDFIAYADGKSFVGKKPDREGVVFKRLTPERASFKIISNKFLLKTGE